MDFCREQRWYAIYTKRCREDVAAFNIQRLGLDVFAPKMKQRRVVADIAQMVVKPVFPSYLFARFSAAAYLHLIQYARGVVRVVAAGDVPIPIDEIVIDALKARVGTDGCMSFEPESLLPGDRVVISEGPFQGLRGLFEKELNDRKRVIILLEAIEYQARIMLERPQLKIVVGNA